MSSSSTSSSLGDRYNPNIPTHHDPRRSVPEPGLTSISPSPDEGSYSPLSGDAGTSLPASEDVEQGPKEHMFAERRVMASCSCRSIQHLASEDLKKGSKGDLKFELTSPRTVMNTSFAHQNFTNLSKRSRHKGEEEATSIPRE